MSTTKEEQESLNLKIKKPSFKREKSEVYKIDLNKTPEENAISNRKTKKVDVGEPTKLSEEVDQGTRVDASKPEETSVENKKAVITEITEDTTKDSIEEKIVKKEISAPVDNIKIPDNIKSLITFMKDTGGDLEDYVRLNADYTNVDDKTLLKEYYKTTKSHLNSDEIAFHMEDNFSYDEEEDEERIVKKKQLALKDEVAKAKNFLEDTKQKYYEEIKLRTHLTEDQQKANDFYNRYNKEQETAKKRHGEFTANTNDYFNEEFKGFDFKLGDKKFRYGVNNPQSVATKQSNIQTFLKKFLNEEGHVDDYKGYHKAIYAANNADEIAEHFYEQGKSDAIKNMVAKSNNISNEPRPQDSGDVYINGWKVKAISGVDSSKLKIKHKIKK